MWLKLSNQWVNMEHIVRVEVKPKVTETSLLSIQQKLVVRIALLSKAQMPILLSLGLKETKTTKRQE